MKKAYKLLTAALVCILLAGCCLSHEWQDATCTAPKTCVKCEETEGEALDHSWEAATCTTPKTCTVCGGTEGEVLGHGTLTEANYQQPSYCTVCGEAQGEPLPAAFETFDIQGRFVELYPQLEYKYVTTCSERKSSKTTGKVRVIEYETFASDEEHPAKEGYEWKTVTFQLVFSDANANGFGFLWDCQQVDYYNEFDPRESDSELQKQIDKNDKAEWAFSVNWHGKEYSECIGLLEFDRRGWNNRVNHVYAYCDFLIPEGYDGVVFAFRDASLPESDGRYINEIFDVNTLLFRLD